MEIWCIACDGLQSISRCIYVDSKKSLNCYGANYCACLNWDVAHNRAILRLHLNKSVEQSYINLEQKTLNYIVYEDKMSAQSAQQRSNFIVFQCASLNIFVVVYLTNWNTTLIGRVTKTSYMNMHEKNYLFIVNIVVSLKLKEFVVQNVRFTHYSAWSK